MYHLHGKGEKTRVAPSRKKSAGGSFNTSQIIIFLTGEKLYERAVEEVTLKQEGPASHEKSRAFIVNDD